MIRDVHESYIVISSAMTSDSILSPEEIRSNIILQRSARHADALFETAFAWRFPDITGYWGISDQNDANASICKIGGEVHIVVTRGAFERFALARRKLSDNQRLSEALIVAAFGDVHHARNLTSSYLGEALELFSIAAILGHELGHAVDRFDVQARVKNLHDLELAEESSADGHAALAGLAIIEAWAADMAGRSEICLQRLRRLGAILLVMANSLLDDILLEQDWVVSEDQTHPTGSQRLLGFCVHVNDHFREAEERGFGVVAMAIALTALGDLGLGPRFDFGDIKSLVDNYNGEIIER